VNSARLGLAALTCLSTLAGCNPDRPPRAYLDRYRAPLHIAHRGGGDELPEHTLYAYDFSLLQHGTDVLEIDVHRTCDGQLVITHDDTLDRVAGRPFRVADVSLAYLRALRIPFPPLEPGAPDPRTVQPVTDPRLLRVPTLREVVERYRNCLINIEVKDPDASEEVVALLTAHEAPGFQLDTHVCFASFSDQASQRLQRLVPRACHTYPTLAAACAALPRALPGFLRLEPRTCPDYDLFALPDWLVDRGVVDSVHGLGRPVYVWTINDRARMGELLDAGVDAVMTDRPGLLRAVFRERGLPARAEREEEKTGPAGACAIEPRPLEDPPAGAAVPCGPPPSAP
jgi:glycerophosphoryl diester phosphodiesterase